MPSVHHRTLVVRGVPRGKPAHAPGPLCRWMEVIKTASSASGGGWVPPPLTHLDEDKGDRGSRAEPLT